MRSPNSLSPIRLFTRTRLREVFCMPLSLPEGLINDFRLQPYVCRRIWHWSGRIAHRFILWDAALALQTCISPRSSFLLSLPSIVSLPSPRRIGGELTDLFVSQAVAATAIRCVNLKADLEFVSKLAENGAEAETKFVVFQTRHRGTQHIGGSCYFDFACATNVAASTQACLCQRDLSSHRGTTVAASWRCSHGSQSPWLALLSCCPACFGPLFGWLRGSGGWSN